MAHHDKSPKNKRNPKQSPIGNNFGFLSSGGPSETQSLSEKETEEHKEYFYLKYRSMPDMKWIFQKQIQTH